MKHALTGRRFGHLTVVAEPAGPHARCRCDCGAELSVKRDNLRSGHTNSCGCLRVERNRARLTTHGQRRTPAYRAWQNMVKRCHNERAPQYERYGGRGIRVCERWREFAGFYSDVGDRPSAKYSLDRIDNSRGYEPGNVRWTTIGEQNRNKRNNIFLTFQGEVLCLSDWAKRLGVSRLALRNRIKSGWAIERALTEPVRKRAVSS